MAVHPHHGTVVQGPEDVGRLLEISDVGLCLDTGHVMVGAETRWKWLGKPPTA